MLRKRLVYASATLIGLASAMVAHAAPAVNLLAMQRSGAPAVKADYYFPGYDYGVPPYYGEVTPYYEGERPYYGEVPTYDEGERPDYGRGLADLPGAVIGGALGVIGDAIGGALNGPDYYSRPYYGPFYGRSYYYGESPEGTCAPDSPYFDPRRGACLPDSGQEYWGPYPER